MNAATGTKRITICQICRRRLHMQRVGAWYHDRNASEFCHPGDGTRRKAVPLEIAVSDGEPACGVDWGSATASQRCVRPGGHGGVHIDAEGHEWGYVYLPLSPAKTRKVRCRSCGNLIDTRSWLMCCGSPS